ncbi:hypothetical protein [Streptomyces omiyaensis]|uniref:Secreted protein n=1 Tax=Streptomyces omiyaensis TaxID=68247 RepID=A0ABW7C316_9ACTN|nr:hypothetical protein [Streptomyces omiyaensis]GGY69485.1 hypothetical protein GCM10010363_58410 [Streptomyces omiyaensis]
MKKLLTAAALTAFAATGALASAATATADTGGLNLPSVVPLSGVLAPKPKPAAAPEAPAAGKAVEGLLPGRH